MFNKNMTQFTFANRSRVRQSRRGGFTLIELLVVIGIILLLASITATTVNITLNNDRVRGAARQVQSYLTGARDRAIYAKAPRGVRFLLDPTNNRTVSSLVFIQQTDPWTQGTIQLERLDVNNDGNADKFNITTMPNPPAEILRGFDNDTTTPFATPTNWVDLYNRGLLYDGLRIKIPNDSTGTYYTIATDLLKTAISNGPISGTNPPRLRLTTPYLTAPTNTANGQAVRAFLEGGASTYQIELPPSVMPNADPILLPKGAVVHLDRCTLAGNLEQQSAVAKPKNRGDRLPSSWKNFSTPVSQSFTGAFDPSGFDYNNQMDVMFSPRGVVTGTAGQRGVIHFYLAEQKDADRDRLVYWSSTTYPTASAPEYGSLADQYERGNKSIVTLFTRTGAVSAHPVFSNADPFKFAETGEVAGK